MVLQTRLRSQGNRSRRGRTGLRRLGESRRMQVGNCIHCLLCLIWLSQLLILAQQTKLTCQRHWVSYFDIMTGVGCEVICSALFLSACACCRTVSQAAELSVCPLQLLARSKEAFSASAYQQACDSCNHLSTRSTLCFAKRRDFVAWSDGLVKCVVTGCMHLLACDVPSILAWQTLNHIGCLPVSVTQQAVVLHAYEHIAGCSSAAGVSMQFASCNSALVRVVPEYVC